MVDHPQHGPGLRAVGQRHAEAIGGLFGVPLGTDESGDQIPPDANAGGDGHAVTRLGIGRFGRLFGTVVLAGQDSHGDRSGR